MANTRGEKELRTDWPNVSGLESNQKHEGRQENLVAEEGSNYPERLKAGLGY